MALILIMEVIKLYIGVYICICIHTHRIDRKMQIAKK